MFFSRLTSFVLKPTTIITGIELQQIRTKFADHLMKRDFLRRKLVERENITRLRINALRKNTILPRELQEVADAEIAALPYRTSITHLTNRCVITSRARGKKGHRANIVPWRVSRFIFRHLSDYNKMSGVIRAHW